MFDRPWVRLVLGALAAALLGGMAARVAVSAVAGGDGAGAVAGARGGGSDGSGRGSSGAGRGSGFGNGSSSGGSGAADGASSSGGASATLGGGSGRVTVHVTGEVRRPGVYALQEGARVNDAVRRAGGATAEGDRQALNLAAALRDGQQVRVPPKAVAAGPGGGASGVGGGTSAAGGAGGTGPGSAGPIDLNTASLEELQTLDGVGEATAAKIVQLREQRGGLSGVDDLDEVPGIGAKKLEALRAQVEP